MIKNFFWVVAGVAVLVAMGWFINNFMYVTWDFRNNLWAPAYLLVHGRSPYHIQEIYSDGSTAIWFPQIIGGFFFLGFLSIYRASNVWMILNVLILISMAAFLTWRNQPRITGLALGFILISVSVFPPTMTNIMLGQADFLLTACMLLAAWKIQEQDIVTAALSLVLATSKPQLCFIVVPTIFLTGILKKKWVESIKLLGCFAAFFMALTLPLWAANRYWLQDLIHNLQNNPGWLQPSLFSLLTFHFGRIGLFLWLAIAACCIAVSIFFWFKLPVSQAILWSLALTTIAAPYVWSWDFTLLLPLFVDTASRLTKTYSRLALVMTWIICFFFSIWSRQITESDHRLWWMPLMMLIGITTSLWIEYSRNKKSILLRVYTQPVQS